MKTRRVLIVEDEHALAVALSTVVVRAGAEPVKAASGRAALAELAGGEFSLIVLDIGLPDMSGLDLLAEAFPDAGELPVPVLVITAHGNLENAIAARKLGVAEYLVKPLDLSEFQGVLGRYLKPVKVVDRDEVPGDDEATLIGGAGAMQPVFRDVAHACSVSIPVVISGATGTGKSLAARVIHANGEQRGGAIHRLAGLADRASGSLLVEDVDTLSAEEQAGLLEVLDRGEGELRVIATTRGSLHEAVTGGRFREDLYYRLNVLEIHLPELAERIEDVPALAQYFLGRATSERALEFSPEAMVVLEQHHWPGNVLELRNAVEYAVGVCSGRQILPQHLPVGVVMPRVADGDGLEASLRAWLDAAFEEKGDELRYAELSGGLEGKLLAELLRRFDGKPTRLAAAMGMNRTTLRKKCAELLGDR